MIGSEVSPYFSPCPERRFSSTTRKATMTKATKPALQIPPQALDVIEKAMDVRETLHSLTRIESAGVRILGNIPRDILDPVKTKRHIDNLTALTAQIEAAFNAASMVVAALSELMTEALPEPEEDDPDGADG